MKKLLACLFILTAGWVNAQTPANVGGVETPTVITEQFTKHHPAVTPNWSKDGDNYKAIYEDPNSGKAVMIIYDKKGEVVRTENEMDNVTSPQTINEYYKKNYPDEQYKVFSAQDNTGVKSYYVNRNNKIMRFDKDGNYIPDSQPKSTGK